MVIALYTPEELSAKVFPPAKRNMMEKFFVIRVVGSEERKSKFNSLFGTAIKEALVRNSKTAEKLNKIQLPGDIFDRKKASHLNAVFNHYNLERFKCFITILSQHKNNMNYLCSLNIHHKQTC